MKYNRRHGLNHVVVRFSSASGVGGRSGFGLQSFRSELEMLFSAVRASSYEWYAIGLELIKWKYSLTGDLVQTRPSCSCSGFVFNCSRGRYGTAADNMPVLRFCLMWLCAALITRDRSRAPSCAPAARSWRGGFDWKLACHLRLVTGDAEGGAGSSSSVERISPFLLCLDGWSGQDYWDPGMNSSLVNIPTPQLSINSTPRKQYLRKQNLLKIEEIIAWIINPA